MRIGLVIGHRRGAQGANSVDLISEYAFWKTYLHTIISQLPEHHEYKIFERYDSDGRSYSQRIASVVENVNNWDADLVISFHFNSAGNENAEGYEILTTNYSVSKKYASDLLSWFDNELSGDNRGNKVLNGRGRGYGFLKPTHMPSMIVEPFFGSSRADWDSFLDNIDGFTNSLKNFFNNLI